MKAAGAELAAALAELQRAQQAVQRAAALLERLAGPGGGGPSGAAVVQPAASLQHSAASTPAGSVALSARSQGGAVGSPDSGMASPPAHLAWRSSDAATATLGRGSRPGSHVELDGNTVFLDPQREGGAQAPGVAPLSFRPAAPGGRARRKPAAAAAMRGAFGGGPRRGGGAGGEGEERFATRKSDAFIISQQARWGGRK